MYKVLMRKKYQYIGIVQRLTFLVASTYMQIFAPRVKNQFHKILI